MAEVTFQVLEGLERGEIFWNLPTPVTLGREEDNHIRLNDERVSRFHAKVQEDDGCFILTDLESTNGTRVNGHPVKMRVLKLGDQIHIGRCLLLFGSPEQIADKMAARADAAAVPQGDQTVAGRIAEGPDETDGNEERELFPEGAPELPQNLSALQTAQLSDVLAYVHARILAVLTQGSEQHDDNEDAGMLVDMATWHDLQQLEMRLSQYLKGIADPGVD